MDDHTLGPRPAAARRNAPAKALDRLCLHLAEEGAFGIADAFDPGMIRLVGTRNGVARILATLPVSVAEQAISEDIAVWSASEHGAAKLRATEAGLARAARLSSSPDIDSFQQQHVFREIVEIAADGGKRRVIRNVAESPLAWLRQHQSKGEGLMIGEAEFAAGERLRIDLDRALMLPRVTANWNAAVASRPRGGADIAFIADATLAARQRAERALAAVGSEFSGLLIDVCGFLKGLSRIESERRWPARSAKVVLALALRRLATHYGLSNTAIGQAQSEGIEAWLAEGARPLMS
jgi:hypothetical protein